MPSPPAPLCEHRLTIFVGHYGSGKTELSLNLALARRASGLPNVALVDLDIVNPYFRSAERVDLLTERGLRVFMPRFALTGVDIPALPPEILTIFEDKTMTAIIDAGGDDPGAKALGMYKPYFEREGQRMFYVINGARPRSSDAGQILSLMERIEARARLPIAGIVHNTNVADETTADQIAGAHEMVLRVSQSSGAPIVAVTGMQSVLDTLPPALDALKWPIERLMMYDWQM